MVHDFLHIFLLLLIDFSRKNSLPHKGSRHFLTVPDMPDMSESDYIGLYRIISDYVGLCRNKSDISGTFVWGGGLYKDHSERLSNLSCVILASSLYFSLYVFISFCCNVCLFFIYVRGRIKILKCAAKCLKQNVCHGGRVAANNISWRVGAEQGQ